MSLSEEEIKFKINTVREKVGCGVADANRALNDTELLRSKGLAIVIRSKPEDVKTKYGEGHIEDAFRYGLNKKEEK